MSEIKEETLPTQELQEVVTPAPEPKFDKMNNREALERAITEKRETQPSGTERKTEAPQPTKSEVKQAVEADLEAPAEFSAAGKQAWKDKNITGIQKEFRRIHDSRTAEISRAQTEARLAREEAKSYSDIDNFASEYVKERAKEGVPKGQAMREAFQLIYEFKKGDPSTVKAELKRIGIDLDAAPGAKSQPTEDPRYDHLQKTVDSLIKEREDQKIGQIAQTFESVFSGMRSQVTRTGEPVFPDLLDYSEEGIEFARVLGSRTKDPYFIKRVRAQFPDADFSVLVREAYKSAGGRVQGEPVQVSKNNQQHIEKSRRAAASTPGRVVARNDASNLVGKLSRRAALARAIEEQREH